MNLTLDQRVTILRCLSGMKLELMSADQALEEIGAAFYGAGEPVAFVTGDSHMREIRWNPKSKHHWLLIGTPLYAPALASPPTRGPDAAGA